MKNHSAERKKRPNTDLPAIVPEPIRESVSRYLAKASHLEIDANRVLACASLLALAESSSECHFPAGPTLPTVPYGPIGGLFGLSWEESKPEIVIPVYRRARKAMQQVNASASAAFRQIKKLEAILRDNHEALPLGLREYRSPIS